MIHRDFAGSSVRTLRPIGPHGGLKLPYLCVTLLLCASAQAQEPPNAIASATSPSPGHFVLKEAFRFASFRLDEGPRGQRREGEDYSLTTTLSIGVLPELAIQISAPATFRRENFDFRDRSENEAGVGDALVLAKWRIWRNDSTALNTQRLSLLAGAEIRTGDNPFTTDGYNPALGFAYTQIHDRHGFNAAALWRFTANGVEGPTVGAGQTSADLFNFDLAYAYRLWPAEYAADTPGAWYALLELNGIYETNGDAQLFLSPGVMWEASTWVWEFSVQVPVWQTLENRAETDFVLMTGVRVSF